jgi:hypothetical protein
MTYPAEFPCPIRADYAVDMDYRTRQVQMECGYIMQRREEPYIFRQVQLTYFMRMDEFFTWFSWANRFGFDWFTATVQGAEIEIRYMSDIDFDYNDYATVIVNVTAEQRPTSVAEIWEGADPVFYEPPINAADGVVDENVTPDYDLNGPLDVTQVVLDTVPKVLIIRTPDWISAIGAVYIYSASQLLTMELWDYADTTLIASSSTGQFRWHQDPSVTNDLMRLTAGADYLLKITGALDSTIEFWGHTQ